MICPKVSSEENDRKNQILDSIAAAEIDDLDADPPTKTIPTNYTIKLDDVVKGGAFVAPASVPVI
eukprot:CAMPEP_0204617300 /NCGR_PEP_ID=MMETSP0717-20131115/4315_1 /ASSEMBLY_ACC=CAM_ASM_000666 /TAXON_ID=230516 /ORGANISM="Chaetoceros curvisetus" /LENGTH=64 /DNA_ID=CAMNT_0051630791 /DNA_START=415 /DNA_END=609 /DNA_ORIENTATION=-